MLRYPIRYLLILLFCFILFSPCTVLAQKQYKKIISCSTISAWNTQITLSCNCILVQKDVINSTLKLYSGKNKTYIKAYYSGLSPNGNTVTYKIKPNDIDSAFPNKPQAFMISSSLFKNTVKTTLYPVNHAPAITGFILLPNHQGVPFVKISTSDQECHTFTDLTGYFYLPLHTTKPVTLSIHPQGMGLPYQKSGIITPSPTQATCQNMVLSHTSSINTTFSMLGIYLISESKFVTYPIFDADSATSMSSFLSTFLGSQSTPVICSLYQNSQDLTILTNK